MLNAEGWIEISCVNPVTSGSHCQPLLLLVTLNGTFTAVNDGWCFNLGSDSSSLAIFLVDWVALGCAKPCVCSGGVVSRILPFIHADWWGDTSSVIRCHHVKDLVAHHWPVKILENKKSCGLSVSGSVWGCSSAWSEFRGFCWYPATVPGIHAVSVAPESFSMCNHLVKINVCYLTRCQEGAGVEQRAICGWDALDISGEGWCLR